MELFWEFQPRTHVYQVQQQLTILAVSEQRIYTTGNLQKEPAASVFGLIGTFVLSS